MGLIYIAKCKSTGKVYVGLTTKCVLDRRRDHQAAAKRGLSTKFYRAIRKYGRDDFDWSVEVDGIANDLLGAAECAAIAKHDSIRNGYNTIPGGTVSPMLDPAIAAKVSRSMKGRLPWNKGVPRAEAEKQRMREGHRRRPRTNRPSPLKGSRLSEEHRAKIGLGLIGNTNTRGKRWDESRAIDRIEMSARMTGNSYASVNKGTPKTGRALDAVRANLAKARAAWAQQRTTGA